MITQAIIAWDEQGKPYSSTFNDIYFSDQDGLAETEHVFLAGNQLMTRFPQFTDATFTIAETGFGTGLNFLTTWQAFQHFRLSRPQASLKRLHFISIEKFPLSLADLQRSLAHWPSLTLFSQQLLQQWPIACAGCHRLIFNGGEILLDLWFGDVNQLLPQWHCSYQHAIDAWFLDGFAPSKNPDMWQDKLFHAMGRLTRPMGTFATFTAAGHVRRGLQQAGFVVEKKKGFGRKRDMLVGVWPPQIASTLDVLSIHRIDKNATATMARGDSTNLDKLLDDKQDLPVQRDLSIDTDRWAAAGQNSHTSVSPIAGEKTNSTIVTAPTSGQQNTLSKPPRTLLRSAKRLDTAQEPPAMPSVKHSVDDIAIIGGGIASACTALALLRQGKKVTVYCADDQAGQGASSNRQGVLYPLLNSEPLLSAFYAQAFCFARRYYEQAFLQGVAFEHAWCGVAQIAYSDRHRHKITKMQLSHYPETLIQEIDTATLSQQCGLPIEHGGVLYPHGGWLAPQQLTQQLFSYFLNLGGSVHFNHRLETLAFRDEDWLLHFHQQVTQRHATVILAMGHELLHLAQTADLPLYPVRGQVTHIPSHAPLTQLQQVLCYDGYLTPRHREFNTHCLGASSVREDYDCTYRADEQQQNVDLLRRALPNTEWLDAIDISQHEARCGIRCLVRDHFPMVGAVPNAQFWRNREKHLEEPYYPQLFMIGALGARGLCSAPLCAEILTNHLLQRPQPLTATLMANLDPARLWRREWLKRQKR